jgi:hypothetical protein
VGYALKSLNKAEWNYTTYDKELLAIMRAFEDWWNLLLGTQEPFDIYTNLVNEASGLQFQDSSCGQNVKWQGQCPI